jgi:hypothetical protein
MVIHFGANETQESTIIALRIKPEKSYRIREFSAIQGSTQRGLDSRKGAAGTIQNQMLTKPLARKRLIVDSGGRSFIYARSDRRRTTSTPRKNSNTKRRKLPISAVRRGEIACAGYRLVGTSAGRTLARMDDKYNAERELDGREC